MKEKTILPYKTLSCGTEEKTFKVGRAMGKSGSPFIPLKEKSLSDEIVDIPVYKSLRQFIEVEPIKQSIKRLKKALLKEAIERNLPLKSTSLDRLSLFSINKEIDSIFGNKLIK